MIIDTFLFNNEFDMLDIHLAISENYVDKWIVLEANKTLNGRDKPYNLFDASKKYKEKYGDRLEIITLDIPPDTCHQSYYETSMRRGFKNSLEKYADSDIIIHGDLDEIINPNKFKKIVDLMDQANKPVSCGLEMYMYKFDQKAERGWKGNVVARKHMFQTPHDLYKGSLEIAKRKNRDHCIGVDEPVGWHWTWMGSDEIIKNKVLSCIETDHRDPSEVLAAFKNADTKTAINHKAHSEIIDPVYPEEVMTVLKQYPSFWHKSF
jgi:hypothetical protein